MAMPVVVGANVIATPGQMSGFSRLQSGEQPSPGTLLPSSQLSPSSGMLLPQVDRMVPPSPPVPEVDDVAPPMPPLPPASGPGAGPVPTLSSVHAAAESASAMAHERGEPAHADKSRNGAGGMARTHQ